MHKLLNKTVQILRILIQNQVSILERMLLFPEMTKSPTEQLSMLGQWE